MNAGLKILIAVFALQAVCALADESAEGDGGRKSETVLSEEAWDSADTEALELDSIEVTGEGFTYEQEATLRFIKSAYNRPKSMKFEDRDEWTCWIDEGTGTHFSYLGCARMGDIEALQPDRGIGQMPTGIGGYGTLKVSSRPVRRAKLERAMNSLPGNDALNEEFTLMVLSGEKPPRDLPDEEETQQFVEAYQSVNELNRRGATEGAQVAAIEDAGLSLDRYNRIMDLLEVYGSLKNEIGEMLKG